MNSKEVIGVNIYSVLFGVANTRNTEDKAPQQNIKNYDSKQKHYQCVTNISDLEKYFIEFWNRKKKIVAFDFECSPYEDFCNEKNAALNPYKSDISGISLSHTPNTGIYIPLTHKKGINIQTLSDNRIYEILACLDACIFNNDNILKVAHNISYEAMYLYKHGFIPVAPVFDTMAAAQLTQKNNVEFRNLKDSGLKTLVKELLGVDLPQYEDATKGQCFDVLNPQDKEVIQYACADSDYSLQLYFYLKSWFKTKLPKHYYIATAIESPVAIYTGIMQYNGLKVNRKLMESKQQEAEQIIENLRNEINNFAGKEINIGANASTTCLKNFMYKDLQLPILKRTGKNSEAADDQALLLLKEYCQYKKPEIVAFIESIQKYRKWTKIRSTYIEGYMKHINTVSGRIHAQPLPLKTDTGRFAYNKPNLQNMPRKDNDPVGVRTFFIPEKGYIYLDFDFSQIELRVGAYFCRDEKMLKVYSDDEDIHAMTTSLIYKIPLEEAKSKSADGYKQKRTVAKNVNFGVFFGLFPRGLQKTLKFKAGIKKSEWECKGIINNIKNGYKGIITWQNKVKQEAEIKGYSETALGRRRILEGIRSSDWKQKSFWERCSLNTPIQGTAADILKIAITRILAGLRERPYIRPVLQVHDELLFEVKEENLDEALDFIKDCMEQQPFDGFDVKVKAEGATGYSFGDLKEL